MLVLVPVGWDPTKSEALRAHLPPALLLCLSPEAAREPVDALLAVIYWVVAGRAPTAEERLASEPADEGRGRREAREREIAALFASLEAGTSSVCPCQEASAPDARPLVLWYEVDGVWQLLVRHSQLDPRRARPEEGGWACELVEILDEHGDEREVPEHLAERFARYAPALFLPGDYLEIP